ncbi:MAG: hypothetical protein OXI76_10310 [Gemmatimonadota bacterium]|nr:hypothetical protein [Gemmatimonadota bacterium]
MILTGDHAVREQIAEHRLGGESSPQNPLVFSPTLLVSPLHDGGAAFVDSTIYELAGLDGLTWLRLRTGVDSFEWEVLDESGRAIARVDPPQGGMRWADAESLWFVERDELGISYLVRYVIRRP